MKAGAAGLSGWLALVLLLPMEAGVPIPIPADLVMFTVGERVAAGAFPLWLAVAGFEAVSIIGTTVLFLACRGPAHRLVTRFGPRIGLSRARVSRGAALVERRGRSALAIGRGTPGLRTVTVLAAAASGLGWRRALPALILGTPPAGGRQRPGSPGELGRPASRTPQALPTPVRGMASFPVRAIAVHDG